MRDASGPGAAGRGRNGEDRVAVEEDPADPLLETRLVPDPGVRTPLRGAGAGEPGCPGHPLRDLMDLTRLIRLPELQRISTRTCRISSSTQPNISLY